MHRFTNIFEANICDECVPSNLDVILKASWQPAARESEVDLINRLKDALPDMHNRLPNVVASLDVILDHCFRSHVTSLADRYERRILRFILFEKPRSPLSSDVSDIEEFKKAYKENAVCE